MTKKFNPEIKDKSLNEFEKDFIINGILAEMGRRRNKVAWNIYQGRKRVGEEWIYTNCDEYQYYVDPKVDEYWDRSFSWYHSWTKGRCKSEEEALDYERDKLINLLEKSGKIIDRNLRGEDIVEVCLRPPWEGEDSIAIGQRPWIEEYHEGEYSKKHPEEFEKVVQKYLEEYRKQSEKMPFFMRVNRIFNIHYGRH